MLPTSLLSAMLLLRESLPESFRTVFWLSSTYFLASQPLLRGLLLVRVTRNVDCKKSCVYAWAAIGSCFPKSSLLRGLLRWEHHQAGHIKSSFLLSTDTVFRLASDGATTTLLRHLTLVCHARLPPLLYHFHDSELPKPCFLLLQLMA
ncbi:hypothetical protein B0H19DRAFT_1186632 [Mycena capillaripes]|nr:hypothetical protein B0H19DRAFT_1186632 [Mycena capillaripes]